MDLNHVAVFVDNLERSALAPALGGWGAPIVTIAGQPVTVEGRPGEHSGRTRRIRTASSPPFGVSVEDVAPGAPIQPVPGNAWHHIAVWCEDVAGTVALLEQQGYRKDVVGRGPDGELATFAYMVSDRGPRVELADAAMKARMLEYTARASADAGDGAAAGELSAPLAPCEVAVVVETADDLERLKQGWETAFGADWGEITDESVSVQTAQGESELRTRRVSTTGLPRVTIAVPDPASRALLTPVDPNGWHHVGFASADVTRDAAWLEQCGFTMEFRERLDGGRPPAFVMMRAPEGTRVKLTADRG
jgi:catechol 2,3-dioxygenase-like lactoylglutathione lyase family enzyme